MDDFKITVPKSKKPKPKSKQQDKKSTNRKNPKAFNVANVVSAKRNLQRNLDKAQQKEVVPLVSREESIPPPSLVVVMGPKGVGKTTLIRSLVKLYTGQNLTDASGPITVVAGNKKRITFYECPMDLFSMTDLAKVADLILLMVDASYGFEMETFEFLNILQLHGFPKVLGILTHLDSFRSNKSLQAAKKAIKHRFWTEIYKGAKMFEFLGVINGKYRKHEVKRISLHISRMKFRPLTWRNAHSYLLIDRIEDVTPVNSWTKANPDEKEVTLYGYVRGSHLKPQTKVHLIGAGDYDIQSLSKLPDPCPLKGEENRLNNEGKPMKMRTTLSRKKENLLYAPMANVGRVSMDKDAMYIELKNINYTKKDQLFIGDQNEGVGNIYNDDELKDTPIGLLRSMQDVSMGVDQQLSKSNRSMDMFSRPIANKSTDGEDDYDEDDEEAEEERDEYDEDDYDDEVDEDAEEDDNEEEEEDEDEEGYYHEDDEEEEDEGDLPEEDDEDEDLEEEDDEDDEDEQEEIEEIPKLKSVSKSSVQLSSRKPKALLDDDDDDDDDNDEDEDDDEEIDEDDLITQKKNRLVPLAPTVDIMKVIYGDDWHEINGGKGNNSSQQHTTVEDEDDFFAVKPSFKYDSSSNNLSSGDYFTQALRNNNRIDSTRQCLLLHFAKMSDALRVSINERTTTDYVRLKNRFVTGNNSFKRKLAKQNKANGDNEDDEDDDEEDEDAGDDDMSDIVDGDFEDLEGQTLPAAKSSTKSKKYVASDEEEDDEDDDDSEEEDDEGDEEEEDDDASSMDEDAMDAMNDDIDKELRELNAQKKLAFANRKTRHEEEQEDEESVVDEFGNRVVKKKTKDKRSKAEEEDDEEAQNLLEEAEKQHQITVERNRNEFAEDGDVIRTRYEGYRQGQYVRIHLKGVPLEFLSNFSPSRPVIVGSLLPNETAFGYITARVKRHRWHRRVLKSNDPLIFSVGWRRYQSIPVYTTTDQNDRERFLKYTPEHMHCTATFYGPLIAPNTGILAYQRIDNSLSNFRISLTGIALQQRTTPTIQKKLKLVGTPQKIYKNTAFVTGMFNSALEVAKFEHAKIKTVSGIRGSIKKAVTESNSEFPTGTFRATFEDKILKSDLIVCRLWVNLEIKQFYNPVLSLLKTTEEQTDKDSLGLMRTTAQLRKELQIPQKVSKDSVYKPIERLPREFSKLHVSNKLQEALPFKSKLKTTKAKDKSSYMAKRAVVLEPEERKSRGMIQMLQTIRKDKEKKRHDTNVRRQKDHQKEVERTNQRFESMHKDEKKRKYRDDGLEQQRKLRKMNQQKK